MEWLNYKCLAEILKFLNSKDQVALYHSINNIQYNIIQFWKKKCRHVHIDFLEVSIDTEDFKIFLKYIRNKVEEMQLRNLSIELYEVMKAFQYKNLRTFRFTLEQPYFMEDNDLNKLRLMMPNLRVFSPHGNFSGLNMTLWPRLKELNLSFCFKLEIKHFETILKQLKLKTLKLDIFHKIHLSEPINLQEARLKNLKYLRVNTYEFYCFMSKRLKALKELIITDHYNPRQLFYVLLSTRKGIRIRRLETANIDSILLNCLETNMNIEQLAIVNDENPLPPAHNLTSLHNLTNLRKLRFKNCYLIIRNFINLLKNATQLEDISCDSCQFDGVIIIINVLDVTKNRINKLRLNMWKNRLMDIYNIPVCSGDREVDMLTNVTVDLIGSHNLLELTHIKGEDLCHKPLYVLFN